MKLIDFEKLHGTAWSMMKFAERQLIYEEFKTPEEEKGLKEYLAEFHLLESELEDILYNLKEIVNSCKAYKEEKWSEYFKEDGDIQHQKDIYQWVLLHLVPETTKNPDNVSSRLQTFIKRFEAAPEFTKTLNRFLSKDFTSSTWFINQEIRSIEISYGLEKYLSKIKCIRHIVNTRGDISDILKVLT